MENTVDSPFPIDPVESRPRPYLERQLRLMPLSRRALQVRKDLHDDKRILDEKFNEPAWNYQVVRLLDADGRYLISKKERVWESAALMDYDPGTLSLQNITRNAKTAGVATRVFESLDGYRKAPDSVHKRQLRGTK